ncbi:glycosyltransferase [Solibacillus sp. FSL W7-1436]|uniref:glycosyltransferase n=1 Tax=Solibacillus sp. FSL W7-1436 TaxID=2921705 RepID=UPI0030F537BD
MIVDIVLGRAIGRGGLEKVLTIVSNELKNRGHRVRVCQMFEPDFKDWTETLPEIHYYCRRNIDSKQPTNINQMAIGYSELITQIGIPDIVLATHTPIFGAVCKMAFSSLEIKCPPIISWLHGPPEAYGGSGLLKYCDAHLAISHSISKKIENVIGAKTSIHYVGNPVNIDESNIIYRPKYIYEFLYIGRLNNNEKRLDIMFRAMSKLRGNWRLHIYGDGPNKNELKILANRLGINNRVKWHGWKENPWEEIKEASLLLLSSDIEGFGLVLIEALSRGIPVLSTNCDGPKEIIQEGINGWLYQVRDISTLYKKLQEIINGDINLPEIKICRESVLHYSPQIVVNSIEEILKTYYLKDKIEKEISLVPDLSEEDKAQLIFELVIENQLNINVLFSIIQKNFSNDVKSTWLTRIGVLFWEHQLFDYVIPTFQKAIEYNPNNDDALLNLGYVLRNIGEEELALSYLNKVKNINN